MWIDLKTGIVVLTHSDARRMRPNWSAPSDITDEMMAAQDFALVAAVTPAYDPLRQLATEVAPALVNGVWTQQWEIRPLTSAQIASNMAATKQTALEAINTYLGTVRTLREQILNRLAGIGLAALVANDKTTTDAVLAARQRLLDITKIPDAVAAYAALDLAALELAVKTEYAAIVGGVPAVLVNAFDKVDE